MHKILLVKYPACTSPAMPVLAAAKKPPVNTTAGTVYNQEYSGGSVGPVRGISQNLNSAGTANSYV
jgi:hypothetical protein